MFKVTNKATKTTPWRRFGSFIVNFEHISHICSSVSIVNFEQVNADWIFPSSLTILMLFFALVLTLEMLYASSNF